MTENAQINDLPIDAASHAVWHYGDLSWKLDALQRQIREHYYQLEVDKILILSSRQIGKSFLAILLAIEFCLRNPGKIVRVLAPTLKQVQDIVQDNLLPICADAPPGLIERSKSEYRWRIDKGSLRLGALERAHVDNNRGGNASLVLYEEGGFVSSDDYKYATDSVIGPQLLRSGGREIHITSPSEDSEHHLHTDVLPYCELKDSLFTYTVYDSPSISQRLIDKAIERCGGIDTDAFKREYLAQIIRSKTLSIIPEFNVDKHVKIFEVPEHYRAIFTIDMGGVRDKTAGFSVVWDFKRAKMLITHEVFADRNTQTTHIIAAAQPILNEIKIGSNIYGDVPGQTSIDMEKEFKFPIGAVLKTDRDGAINNLRLDFLRETIEIHPRCKMLIGSLKSCRYNDQRTDFLRSEQFGHADAIMALVYAARLVDRITNPFPAPIINRDRQIQVPYRNKDQTNLAEVAEALVPWNPMKSRL